MTVKDPSITVIVPVYQTAIAFVKVCLEAIANQTYPPNEVIIVDDGNPNEYTDQLLELIDPRIIKIIQQENQGAGAARNAALTRATSKFVTFIDADDIPHPDYCMELKNLVIGEADVGIARYTNQGGSSHLQKHQPSGDLIKQLFLGQLPMGIYAKVFRRAFLEQFLIRFPETVLSEERHFLLQCLHYAPSVAFSNVFIYTRRVHQDSTMNHLSNDNLFGLRRLCELDLAFLQKHKRYAIYGYHCYLSHYLVLSHGYRQRNYFDNWKRLIPAIVLANPGLALQAKLIFWVFTLETSHGIKSMIISRLLFKLFKP